MTSQPVYFHQASAGRRNLARAYGMLVVVAEIAASLLPIADAGFASPGQALAPYVVAVAILLLFCAFNCLAAYRTGTLPGLKSFGVKAVLVEDGGPAEWAAVKKYAVEGFVGLFTLVGGLLLILKYTTDELGRTWFDRLTGIIYVDAHRPIEEESEEWDDEDDLEDLEEAGPAPEDAEPAVADSAFAPRPSEVADAADEDAVQSEADRIGASMTGGFEPAGRVARGEGAAIGEGGSGEAEASREAEEAWPGPGRSARADGRGERRSTGAWGRNLSLSGGAEDSQQPTAAFPTPGRSPDPSRSFAPPQPSAPAPEPASPPEPGGSSERGDRLPSGHDGPSQPGSPFPSPRQWRREQSIRGSRSARELRADRADRADREAGAPREPRGFAPPYGSPAPAASSAPAAPSAPSSPGMGGARPGPARGSHSAPSAPRSPAVGAPAPRGAHARMPVVRLVFDDGVSRDLSGTLVVGRNPSVDPAHRGAELMPIADRQKSVSKTHAALTATPQGLLVEDLRSTNGTVVISADGNPVPVAPGFPIWATDGASVLFGGRRVKVVIR